MRFISFYLLLLTALSGTLVDGQEYVSVSGIVTTFKEIPLNHVTIKSLKAGDLANTDSLGRFSIRCLAKDILLVTASGFDGKRIKTNNSEPVMIDLVFSNKENSFANAVNNYHVSGEMLQEGINTHPAKGQKDYSKYTNIYELIDNEIHTVRVNGTSVTTTKIISMNLSAQVLFIVDGVEVSNISYISPRVVKTIRYSDGVDATMYGMRGANGVILITLK